MIWQEKAFSSKEILAVCLEYDNEVVILSIMQQVEQEEQEEQQQPTCW